MRQSGGSLTSWKKSAGSEPPPDLLTMAKDHRGSSLASERGESQASATHSQLGQGAMERMAPVLYVRNYRTLRRKVAEKTPKVNLEPLRPSYCPRDNPAEMRRAFSRSLVTGRPFRSSVSPSVSLMTFGSLSRLSRADSESSRGHTPERGQLVNGGGRRQLSPVRQSTRTPLLPLWTPADITVKDDPMDSEARLAARRQARAEAREIRMKELERQQREAQLNGEKLDDDSDVAPPPSRAGLAGLSVPSPRSSRGPSSARRFSEDSTEDGLGTPGVLRDSRDLRLELRELEEKLRKTMVTSAQLDNEKSSLTFQLELFKDKLEEVQEAFTQLQRDHRVKCSEYEQLKRVSNRLKEDLDLCQRLLDERDQLIAENGLVLIGDELEDGEGSDAGGATQRQQQKALVTQSAARLLEKAGGGTLDDRLRRLGEERNELEDELRRVKLELEEERHSSARARIAGTGPESEDVQREVARQVGEYKFKQQKSDQEITNLQTSVQRLENQVVRYKSASEAAEKAEEELKAEKRKLQRELREALTRADELETANSHLLKRLDKLKNARSTLLKDLSAE